MKSASKEKRSFQNIIFKSIYTLIILACALYMLKNPIRFWDMLPYMGSVASIDKNEPLYVHYLTYRDFDRFATLEMKASMIEGHSFCKNLSVSPDKFYEQLPFFKIKMLYVYLSWMFYKLRIPLFYAVLIPSILAFIGISLLLYQWIGKHYSPLVAFITSLAFLIFNLNFDAFRIASPDAMASFFILCAAYFYLEKKQVKWAIPFLLLALLTRIDNIIFIDLLFLFIILFNSKTDRKNILIGIGGIGLSILLFLLIRLQSGGYDAYRMFYRSFVVLLENPYTTDVQFNMDDYKTGIKNGLKASMHNKVIYILPVLLIIFYATKKLKATITENIWIVAMLGSFFIRIFIHPLFETRYLFVFIIVMIILIMINIKNYLKKTEN